MKPMIHLGFEVETGKPVAVPLLNLAVTGQTQESGKTTTLEALATRSGAKVITFVTKRGEGSFAAGRRVQPYFRDRADWQFVDALLETALGEKNKYLRQFLIPICRRTKTLADVQAAVRDGLKKAHGQKEGALIQLDAYLELIVPDIARADLAPSIDLRSGLNVMDVSEFSTPMQMLFVQSAIDWVNERESNTVIVIPEAWEFIPEGKGSPVKASAVTLVRKGSGIGNHIWIDSQDMAGVAKTILRGCPVWLIGVQREFNEIKRNIANIPPPTGKPKPGDVALLERGQFFACFGKTLVKVYVQPAWLPDDDAKAVALGAPLTSQPRRPPPKPKEDAVNEAEAAALRAENRSLKARIDELESELKAAVKLDPPPKVVVNYRAPSGETTAPALADIDSIYAEVKKRAMAESPAILKLLAGRPEIELSVTRHTIEMNEKTLGGRLAKLIVDGFFDDGATASAAHTELQRLGRGSAKPNVYRECDKLAELGFLTKESNGYRSVGGMKINVVEK